MEHPTEPEAPEASETITSNNEEQFVVADNNKKEVVNIDDDEYEAKKFRLYVILMELMALISFILVLVWTEKHLGGFAWDGSGRTFNYHPVMMVLGMVIVYGNSAVAYRVLRTQEKFVLKLIHGGLHFLTFIFTIFGLVAVFDFHNKNDIPNMYSLHSWIGITTVVLFACQLLTGFLGFLYPKFDDDKRKAYLSLHVYFGGIIFILAIVSCISGITEKMLFGFMKTYKEFPGVGIVANLLGVSLIIFAMFVGYLLYNPAYKRQEKYEHLE